MNVASKKVIESGICLIAKGIPQCYLYFLFHFDPPPLKRYPQFHFQPLEGMTSTHAQNMRAQLAKQKETSYQIS